MTQSQNYRGQSSDGWIVRAPTGQWITRTCKLTKNKRSAAVFDDVKTAQEAVDRCNEVAGGFGVFALEKVKQY